MKTKKMIITFACVLLAVFALGVTDVARMANTGEDNLAAADRLIGVFITTEHLDLFDIEGYFNDHAGEILSGGEISESESAAYEGRLYAALVEKPYTNEVTGETTMTQEYIFEGVEGISYFSAYYEGTYYGSSGNEAISDGKMAVNSTDAGESVSLEGTIYVSTDGPTMFYYNPVYQTAEGEVYTTTGQGMSYGGDIITGMSGSYSLNEKNTVTKNGETGEVGTDVKVSVCFIDPPVDVTVIQLDGESRVLSREAYVPGELPDILTVEKGTEYIIVETYAAGLDGVKTTTREMFQHTDETLYAFYRRDDGLCIKQYCSIKWND